MELFSIRIQRTFQLVSTERGGRDVFSVVFLGQRIFLVGKLSFKRIA